MQLSSEYQTTFFAALIKNQSHVSIYLVHGIKLTGKIIGETESTIFLDSPISQMIYKRQISTIQENSKMSSSS